MLSLAEQTWLNECFHRFGGYPCLEQVWQLMDQAWQNLGCDPAVIDDRVAEFYYHPVWLLNGLFAEQDAVSLGHRRIIAAWVKAQKPTRIADVGGGFGTLARMIAAACPQAQVEIVEPYPHPEALSRADHCANVQYQPELTGQYDVIIATDVFEHVPDPLAMVESTAHYLAPHGQYLMGNCFFPDILCHLPQTFHFRYSWDMVMSALGLKPGRKVTYARVFSHRGTLSLNSARQAEKRSQEIFPRLEALPVPKGKVRLGRYLCTLLI